MIRFRWLFAVLVLTSVMVACRGGGGSGDGDGDGDADGDGDGDGDSDGDGDGDPPSCDGCRADQVCIDGTCQDVPTSCPCPLETYCDLSTDSCVIGCIDDSDCSTGRICNESARECFVGCRNDGQCGDGRICEGLACREGCRGHEDCAVDEICDELTCRVGCTRTEDCPGGQICDETICRAGCEGDGDCPAATDICDDSDQVCRAGCRRSEDCPLGMVCNTAGGADVCVAGCDGDDGRCSPGEICEGGGCRVGCRGDEDCSGDLLCVDTVCREGCDNDWECSGRSRCDTDARECIDCTSDTDYSTSIDDATNLTKYTTSCSLSGGEICPAGDRDYFHVEGYDCMGACTDSYRWEVRYLLYVEPGVVPACNYSVTWEGTYVDLGPGDIELLEAGYEYDSRFWDRYRCSADVWSWSYFSIDDFWLEVSIDGSSPIGASDFRICAFHDG